VETRGVAGAVSGNSGGVIFIGSGNKDARCLFRLPNPKRPEPVLGVEYGFGVASKETWAPELPSDREDSDALFTGRDNEDVISPDSCGCSASVSERWFVDNLPDSSLKLF
jgi:hypothetical protein